MRARTHTQFDLSSVVLFSNRAAALTKLGRFDAALADADAALALRPDWAKAHFRRGAALFGARRFADAAAAYEAGLALEPDNTSLAQGRDMALATLRQAEAAAAPDRRVARRTRQRTQRALCVRAFARANAQHRALSHAARRWSMRWRGWRQRRCPRRCRCWSSLASWAPARRRCCAACWPTPRGCASPSW
jgi:tetratricopeptide (TPR) repeat protein